MAAWLRAPQARHVRERFVNRLMFRERERFTSGFVQASADPGADDVLQHLERVVEDVVLRRARDRQMKLHVGREISLLVVLRRAHTVEHVAQSRELLFGNTLCRKRRELHLEDFTGFDRLLQARRVQQHGP